MKTPTLSDEQLGAYLDGQVSAEQQRHIAEMLSKDSALQARFDALSALNQRLKHTGSQLTWQHEAVRLPSPSLTVPTQKSQSTQHKTPDKLARHSTHSTHKAHKPIKSAPAQSDTQPKPQLRQRVRLRGLSLAACLLLALILGLVLGRSLPAPEREPPMSATWIYRATQAHRLVSFKDAWQPVSHLDEVPTPYRVLTHHAFRAEPALKQLGYALQGWRVTSDSHSPLALQLVYQTPSGKVATAFIRHHVEPHPQSSHSMVVNGVPTYFTGSNNIDTALIGHDLPFKDPNWQRLVHAALTTS